MSPSPMPTFIERCSSVHLTITSAQPLKKRLPGPKQTPAPSSVWIEVLKS